MPELPEVEITRRKLLPAVCGRRIIDFWTDWPRGLKLTTPARIKKDIRGRKILDVQRRGKVIFLKLSGKPSHSLALHLRMSGRLDVVPAQKEKGPWTHFVWRLNGGRELRLVDPRKFGIVWYGSKKDFERDSYLGRLGRDPRAVPAKDFLKLFRRARGMVKPFLLRQDMFAGIGNIIADESLWQACIHPRQDIPHLSVSEIAVLRRALQRTIREILARGGTTLRNWGGPDGTSGAYQLRRRVYGRAGKPCPRCTTTLERLIVGGRGTTICPRCQRI